ncbi:PIR protein, putative [Plasmodium sp. gorilla clade G1]|nr:PIR protein, putative [Plasmodium sp. gorilla clade G1]
MKVHYINILLFALPLNILEYNQRNHNNTIYHTSNTKRTKTHRSLCELYAPSNYENDPEMKEVMENFNKLTSERFREYEERMEDKRKQCKEQYDKETQQIILKEKIQKVLTEKLAALETNININDIPTCVCEKPVAVKVEKNCLKCGGMLGCSVPGLGLIGGVTTYFQFLDAIAGAIEAGKTAGINKAVAEIGNIFFLRDVTIINWVSKVNQATYDKANILVTIVNEMRDMCGLGKAGDDTAFCVAELSMQRIPNKFVKHISQMAAKAATDARLEAATVTKAGKDAASATSTIVSNFFTNPIGISIIVIIIIVVLLLIIYLILHHRRKKKMKKKLQYIKLLKD